MARVVSVVTFAALWIATVGTPALAHLDTTDRYTHRACPGTAANRTDPINVVFTTWGTWGRAESQIEAHAGWTSTSGSPLLDDELERRLVAAGHSSSRVWWGNTQSFKQCDGDYAASDGWTAFIGLHQVNH